MRRQRPSGPGAAPTRFLGGVRLPPAMAPPASKQSLAPSVKTRNTLLTSSTSSAIPASDITNGDDDLFLDSFNLGSQALDDVDQIEKNHANVIDKDDKDVDSEKKIDKVADPVLTMTKIKDVTDNLASTYVNLAPQKINSDIQAVPTVKRDRTSINLEKDPRITNNMKSPKAKSSLSDRRLKRILEANDVENKPLHESTPTSFNGKRDQDSTGTPVSRRERTKKPSCSILGENNQFVTAKSLLHHEDNEVANKLNHEDNEAADKLNHDKNEAVNKLNHEENEAANKLSHGENEAAKKQTLSEQNDIEIQIDGSLEADLDGSTDSSSNNLNLNLADWGLPETILEKYREKKITSMFRWQGECLMLGQVMDGGNLVYSAPTSAGKTLVAEILMMKRVLETGRKALMILPFVSLAREKMFHLQSLLQDAGVRVEGFMGSHSPAGGLKTTDVAVATIEKANGLVNRLMEEGLLNQLGCVVVDELHLLGDSSRGYLLELLLTKIRYVSINSRLSAASEENDSSVQIIGMSATLPNLPVLAQWLQAELYTTDFRPVPLTEMIKVGSTLFSTDMKPVGVVSPPVKIHNDSDHLTWLSLQPVLDGHSVLVFCPIKSWVEKLAESLAKDFYSLGRPDPTDSDPDSCRVRESLQGQLSGDKLGEVLEQLRRCPAGLDRNLEATIRFGVAFHHAGLTTDERDIVEGGFKNCVIRVLVATSTLSSGVNLPARRVILRCPLTYNNQLMDCLTYKQMIGRAGRKGVDTEGESILLCKEAEKMKVATLVQGEPLPVISCLAVAGRGRLAGSMKRAILEVIVSGAATSKEEVERYASCTLLASQMANSDSREDTIMECVEFLETNEFIRLQEIPSDEIDGKCSVRYVATRLGLACLASSLSPDEGLTVFSELQRARRQFVLENELHIIYQIVPIYAAVSWPRLDWMGFLSMWEQLSEDMRLVGQLVGVQEQWMVRAVRGTVRTQDPKHARALAIHQRFYTALALHDLVHEVSLSNVAAKYGATKGMLQSLQQAAATFAGMVTVFCSRLGWTSMELLVGQFQDRLEFGVKRELIDLCRLTTLDGSRARTLYGAGVTSVAALAAAEPADVENILAVAAPFSSKKSEDDGKSASVRRDVRSVWVTGRPAMSEHTAAIVMVKEARAILQRDLGLKAGAWGQEEGKDGGKSIKTGQIIGKPTKRRRVGSNEVSALGTSVHMEYQMENNKVQDISGNLYRKIATGKTPPKTDTSKSPNTQALKSPNTTAPKSPNAPASKSPNAPALNAKTTLGRGTIISPPKGCVIISPPSKMLSAKKSSVKKIGSSEKQLKDNVTTDIQPSEPTQIENGEFFSQESNSKGNKQRPKRLSSQKQSNVKISRESEYQKSPKDLKDPDGKVGACDRIDISEGDEEDIAMLLSETFDMSSVMENIFIAEEEVQDGKTRKAKKVSWGDEHDEELVLVKSISAQKSEDLGESFVWRPITAGRSSMDMFDENSDKFTPENAIPDGHTGHSDTPLEGNKSYMPKTPKFQVCEEELDLHWTDSEEDSIAEDITNESKKTNANIAGYTFSEDTVTDSFLDKAMTDSEKDVNDSVQKNKDLIAKEDDKNKLTMEIDGEDTVTDSFLDRAMADSEKDANNSNMLTKDLLQDKPLHQNGGDTNKEVEMVIDSEDSMTDSFLDKAMEEHNINADKKVKNKKDENGNKALSVTTRMSLSPGFICALGNMNSQIEFSTVGPENFPDTDAGASGLPGCSTGKVCISNPVAVSNPPIDDPFPSGDESIFITPEPVVRRRTNRSKIRTTKVNVESVVSSSGLDESSDSPNTRMKNSDKLSRRRRDKKDSFKDVTKKGVSPGAVILSDSDSDAFTDSPAIVSVQAKSQNKKVPSADNEVSQNVSSEECLCVIDVCTNQEVFEEFAKEWIERSSYSVAVAVEKVNKESNQGIGAGLKKTRGQTATQAFQIGLGRVVGIAVSWSEMDVFYLSLELERSGPDDTLAEPSQDGQIGVDKRLDLVKDVLRKESAITALSWRKQMGALYMLTGVMVEGSARDPMLAAWLFDPAAPPATLHKLVLDFTPDLSPLLETAGSGPGHGSLAINGDAGAAPRWRAVAEALLVRHVEAKMEDLLKEMGMDGHYVEVECGVERVLTSMELCGMGINEKEYEDTRLVLEAKLRLMEEAAYKMAGRHFSLTSPVDVCKVLYRELHLPVNGDPKLSLRQVHGGRGGVRLTASKEVLEKMKELHALPGIIVEHRRLSSAISKTVAPLLTVRVAHPALATTRVYPVVTTHTATGRVSLHEPNLQNIPKDFQVELTDELKARALGRRAARRRANNSSVAMSPLKRLLSPTEDTASTTVSLRHAIVPVDGHLILAADYSQLELRVMAHLSGDTALIQALSSDGDVFRWLGSSIHGIEPGAVTTEQRQAAKQIVYGILYGMGDAALAQQLGVDVMEAAKFMDKFKARFPGVRKFLRECVADARKEGCVVTMSGRKRKLEDINSSNSHRRTAAERQAVNTKVQGSAADLVKAAMIKVEESFKAAWPDRKPLKWSLARDDWSGGAVRGSWLILQLHDELLYEVHGEDVVQAALLVRAGMEAALPLAVPTPITLKVGPTWGALQTFNL